MAAAPRKKPILSTNVTIAENRRARFDYAVEETIEAGIVLSGTELKSLRLGQCSLSESHAGPKFGELYVFGVHIPEYQAAGKHLQHTPRADRKLLLHKREIARLMGSLQRDGYTLVPLKLYFNDKGRAKLLLGLGKGKKNYDKRESIKTRDWNRQKAKVMKERG
jgi:SsrA-binding protein